MRQQPSLPERQLSLTVWLLIINAGVFFVQSLLRSTQGGAFFLQQYLYLSTEGILNGFFWQLLTYQFLHGDVFHLLINCVVLYFVGRHVENALGGPTFLKLYFLSGALGGLLQVIFGIMWPDTFGVYVVGASAGVYGLVAAFAAMAPEQPLTFLLMFVLPINIRAKWLILGALILSVLGIVSATPGRGGIAHAAHLGGLIGGIGYTHWLGLSVLTRGMVPSFEGGAKRTMRRSRPVRAKKPRHYFWRQPKSEVSQSDSDLPPAEFMRKEVDPILEKISAHGIHSLTERERRILDAARSRMSKR